MTEELSQSLVASASSASDSRHLSRTRQAKANYGRAARAFLYKDHRTSLLESQHAVNILASSPNLGMSLTSSNLVESDHETNRLVEKLAILRLTVLTSVFVNSHLKSSVLDQLKDDQEASSNGHVSANTSFTASLKPSQQLTLLLHKEPTPFITTMWFESLRLCSHTAGDADTPSLDPSPGRLLLALELPSSVISADILAALRLDDLGGPIKTGTNAARLISEWYLAAYSSGVSVDGPSDKAVAAYEKVVNLYALHVLAAKLGEWEYAREFVGYSSLEEPKKLSLLSQLDGAHAHISTKPERESEAAAAAQKSYEEEKARRAAAEKEAKGKDASGKVVHVAKGVTDFLRGGSDQEEIAKAKSRRNGAGDASSGSESGTNQKSRSEYFSPPSSSASPATYPGSARSARSDSSPSAKEENGGKKRSSSRSNSKPAKGERSSRDGDASDATAGSDPSRGKRDGDRDDTSYASNRAHVSRYLKHRPLDRPSPQDPQRPRAVSRQPVTFSENVLNSLKGLFDFDNSQSRSYLFSTVLLLFIFYRFVRRPATNKVDKSAATGRRQESVAARNARNRLSQRGQGSDSILGLGYLLVVWRKVMETIKMGTQVTYL